MGLPQVLRDSTHFVFSGYHIRDSSGTCHSSPALWFSPHRLNQKSQRFRSHVCFFSYFSVVYFYGVNLKILCVDWLLLHIFCVVWFLVLSLRHCNCKSNPTAMCCVSLDFPNSSCVLCESIDRAMCCVSLDFPTNGAVCCVSGVPPTVNSTGSSDDQRLLSHSVLYSTFPLYALLYSTFPAYTLLFQFMLYALIYLYSILSQTTHLL